jgi:glycosyltransferase involved in cell wall biosynthesis
VCVGRLEEQKNLKALIPALEGLPGVTLAMIGEGSLRSELTALAAQHNVAVDFLGTRSHAELPTFLNQAAVFILPSLYEGNPKALVEAMACGVPVVGTNVPGIREILVHGQNGYVCGTSAGEIRTALKEVLADGALREHLSREAVAYVRATCSLALAVSRELAVLQAIAGESTRV